MSKSCPKCSSRMEEGFIPDTREHQAHVDIWVEGKPEFGFFGKPKTRGRKKLNIETWRCGRCAYLESYAPQA